MSVYTVHAPPLRAGEASPDPDRFAFVRDGFSFWAFVLAPVWMLWRRLWLVFVIYLVVSAGLEALVRAFGASAFVVFLVGLLIALLVGLEAGTLRRFTLSRRGWKSIGVVGGDDVEDAERRFFDTWVRTASRQSAAPPAATPPAPSPPAASVPRMPQSPGVIGLFPEPGAPR